MLKVLLKEQEKSFKATKKSYEKASKDAEKAKKKVDDGAKKLAAEIAKNGPKVPELQNA